MEIIPCSSFISNKKKSCNPVTFWKRSHCRAMTLHSTDCKVTLGSTYLTYKRWLHYIKPNIKPISPLHLFFVLRVSQPACTLHTWSRAGFILHKAALNQSLPALRRGLRRFRHPVQLRGAAAGWRHGQKPSSRLLNSKYFGFCLCKQIHFYSILWVAQSGIWLLADTLSLRKTAGLVLFIF